jgi:hypothetical protein
VSAPEEHKEIEITAEMIDAGVMAMFSFDNDEMFRSPEERVTAIFIAMICAKSAAKSD